MVLGTGIKLPLFYSCYWTFSTVTHWRSCRLQTGSHTHSDVKPSAHYSCQELPEERGMVSAEGAALLVRWEFLRVYSASSSLADSAEAGGCGAGLWATLWRSSPFMTRIFPSVPSCIGWIMLVLQNEPQQQTVSSRAFSAAVWNIWNTLILDLLKFLCL